MRKHLLQINKQIIFDLDLSKIGGSALTDNIPVPIDSNDNIPNTYVPARNTIFLSLASSFAERLNISDIFIGANIIGTVGSKEKENVAKSLGCDFVINYNENDFEKLSLDFTKGDGVDVIYDSDPPLVKLVDNLHSSTILTPELGVAH